VEILKRLCKAVRTPVYQSLFLIVTTVFILGATDTAANPTWTHTATLVLLVCYLLKTGKTFMQEIRDTPPEIVKSADDCYTREDPPGCHSFTIKEGKHGHVEVVDEAEHTHPPELDDDFGRTPYPDDESTT